MLVKTGAQTQADLSNPLRAVHKVMYLQKTATDHTGSALFLNAVN